MNAVSDGVVLAVDQGTGSTKGLALDANGTIVAQATRPLTQDHPRPGFVEQDPAAIADSVLAVLAELRDAVGAPIAGIGLSTQRESAVAWDVATGEPLSPVVGWQDRRTAAKAASLAPGLAGRIRDVSGLPVDPMFSALKFEWILDRCDPSRSRARDGRIALGTVDSWLLARLTGERRIELGNASRTQLLDVRTGHWSDELADAFRIPLEALPGLAASDAPSLPITGVDLGGARVTAVLGDSHAALFGHGIRRPGEVKATFGTGSSVMGLDDGGIGGDGIVRTVAWQIDGRIQHAFEGNILSTGGTLSWLSRLLKTTPEELAELARATADSRIDVVPAFAGLGAPWWDDQAVGLVCGLTLGTGPGELARGVLDSIVLQVEDVLEAAERETGRRIDTVSVDGAPSADDWLMQRQADLSGRTIRRPSAANLSALGAAWLAGQSAGVYDGSVRPFADTTTEFAPAISAAERAERRARWHHAVSRSRLPSEPSLPEATSL